MEIESWEVRAAIQSGFDQIFGYDYDISAKIIRETDDGRGTVEVMLFPDDAGRFVEAFRVSWSHC